MISDLENFDLNLLSVVRSLVKYKSTKATALHLGISQASVSRNVAKINQTFGQNLFTRSAHGMEASALAQKLANVAEEMLIPLQTALDEFSDFDAEAYTGSISLVIDPYILDEQAESLIEICHQSFPNAQLVFEPWNQNSLEALKSGEFDYAITDQDIVLPQAIYQEKLYDEQVVLIARDDHPVLSRDHSLEEMLSLPIVSIPAPGIQDSSIDLLSLYPANNSQAQIVLKTQSLRTAASYLLSTHAIMFGSPSTAKHFDGISTYPLPQLINNMKRYEIYGGFLQIKRNNPFTQHLHSVIQLMFQDKNFLFQ
ncbi:transcriptional regulator [Vibrio ishigakensis]|uniref:Transcriptional regulator n=1 Tax=Vibrio ishigakensis TaxID=1481914 RepID=A0A0B8NMK7_9VIBR|nr:LysR family transcriptional regulator [Vibrio ishigakensis]GAM55890.1 transcriptional regulator [Vibrio ishigakensis]